MAKPAHEKTLTNNAPAYDMARGKFKKMIHQRHAEMKSDGGVCSLNRILIRVVGLLTITTFEVEWSHSMRCPMDGHRV